MAGKPPTPTHVHPVRVDKADSHADSISLQMNLAAQVALPKANIPKTVTLMKMHPRRKAEAKDQRPKSPKSKMRRTRSSDAYAASMKRKKILKGI
jgi:hypothetical protein